MKKSEIRRLVAKWRDLKQRSRNHELSEKLKEIEHRYYHETGKKLEEEFRSRGMSEDEFGPKPFEGIDKFRNFIKKLEKEL